MKVVVTGVSGFLGAFVARDLVAHGHQVRLFTRKEPAAEFNALEKVYGDTSDFAKCMEACAGMDAVIHVAAVRYPTDQPVEKAKPLDAPYETFSATMRVNLIGQYNMLQAAVRCGVGTFVWTGSNCALGHGYRISGRPFPIEYLPLDEKHPSDIEDSYSYTKLAGELLCEQFTNAYGIRTYALRCGWMLDEPQRKDWKKGVQPTRSLYQVLNAWGAVEDCAEAHRLVMEKAASLPPHDVYFVHSNDTLAPENSMEIIRCFAPETPLLYTIQGHGAFISNEKLKKAVGWDPRITWRDENID